jgi:acyl-homoserine lactone acylase PvdQ
LRDRSGTPHICVATEADALFGVGHASAQDRLLKLFQRRAIGRLADVPGERFGDAVRRFVLAGLAAGVRPEVAR